MHHICNFVRFLFLTTTKHGIKKHKNILKNKKRKKHDF